jgi:hypothetical protein
LNRSEDRNQRQRETLKKKYDIVEKDKLLEKIDCLRNKLYFYEHPEEVKKYIKRTGDKFIISDLCKDKKV